MSHICNVLISVLFVLVFWGCSNKVVLEDDRIVDRPLQDSILEEMILECKHSVNRFFPNVSDTNRFYVTFELHTRNDSNIIWVMGDYKIPMVLHDSLCHTQSFIGYFKRKNDFCFVYNNLYWNETANANPIFISNLLNGWRMRISEHDSTLFANRTVYEPADPLIVEFSIDSIGDCKLLRKGRW